MSKPFALLLHGKGGSPNGTVRKLARDVRNVVHPHCVSLAHRDPTVTLAESVAKFMAHPEFVATRNDPSSFLIGVSMGGLVAACAQDAGYAGTVIAISSPTRTEPDNVSRLLLNNGPHPRRVVLYGPEDDAIKGRCETWPAFAQHVHALPWLTHDTDRHLPSLVYLISGIVRHGPAILPTLLEATSHVVAET